MSYYRNNHMPEYAAYGGVLSDEAYGRANGGVPFAEAYGKKRNVNNERENRPTLREQLEANWRKIKEREEEERTAAEVEEDEESLAKDKETFSDNQSATVDDEDFVFGQPSSYSSSDNIDKINDFVKHYNEMHQSISPQLYGDNPQPNFQEQCSMWDMAKQWGNDFADATQAATVGYATGTTLGNFDEAMGAATAAVTFNKDNYAMGRDATRKLQNDLSQRHPYIYTGAEFLGAMNTPMHLVKDDGLKKKAFNALTDTINASAGYAQDWDDFKANMLVNSAANLIGLGFDKIPFTRNASEISRKFIKQGMNSSADKAKNMFYNKEEEERK